MEQTLRRVGAGVIVSFCLVWTLAVIALLVTRLAPGPVPAVVDWTVTAGATIGIVIGLAVTIYRIPRYIRRFQELLFR
jgi:hypothetical protein